MLGICFLLWQAECISVAPWTHTEATSGVCRDMVIQSPWTCRWIHQLRYFQNRKPASLAQHPSKFNALQERLSHHRVEQWIWRSRQVHPSHAAEYTMGVRPCVTAKLPVLRPLFWNLILLNLAAASCYFIASLGGRVRCKHPFIGRCKMWNCQCPTPAGCICSNSGAICSAGQWNRGTKFRYGDILRIVAKMLASPVPLLSQQCWFVREEAEHTRISLATLVSDRLRHSHLKLRPLHCQVTTRQSPCLWHITTLILEIMTRALSNYDRLIPLSVTDYDPRTWNYDPCTLKLRPANPLVCDRLRPLHLKLRPVHFQFTTR